jgi:glycosyltransferase involved in cell wall biosynthesis
VHILYLHQYFVPPDGTGGTRSYEMARRLVAAGHKVTLITSSAFFPEHYAFRENVTRLTIEGIEVRILQVPYSNRMSFGDRVRAFFRFALHALFEGCGVADVDVVFASSTPLTIALPAVATKVRHRCPMVFEVRDLWPEVPIAMGALRHPATRFAARLLERLAYRSSRRIVALSSGMAEGIRKTGFPGERIAIIPNGCDVDLFRATPSLGERFLKEYPFLKGGPVISYTGTLGAVNGVEYCAEIAAAMVKLDPSCRFLVAGDGRNREAVIQRAIDLGVWEKNFWLLPALPKNSLPALLAASTMASSFVINLPELWNNCANKFFDSLAAGRPILINHEGWQADFLRQSGAGLVVPPEDPHAAALILHEFLSNPVRVENARMAARTAADDVFHRDKMADALLGVLEDAVNE